VLVEGNRTVGNTGNGIHVQGSDHTISRNSVIDHGTGIRIEQTGNAVFHNSGSGNTTFIDDVPGSNDVGPPGSSATSMNPWANIQF
jgi:hypothetical protein